jgi:hypothetical protein
MGTAHKKLPLTYIISLLVCGLRLWTFDAKDLFLGETALGIHDLVGAAMIPMSFMIIGMLLVLLGVRLVSPLTHVEHAARPELRSFYRKHTRCIHWSFGMLIHVLTFGVAGLALHRILFLHMPWSSTLTAFLGVTLIWPSGLILLLRDKVSWSCRFRPFLGYTAFALSAYLYTSCWVCTGLSRFNIALPEHSDISSASCQEAKRIGPAPHLRGRNFAGAQLSYAQLVGIELTDIDFSYADLSHAVLTCAKLTNVIVDDSTKMMETNFEYATIIGDWSAWSTLRGLHLSHAFCQGLVVSVDQLIKGNMPVKTHLNGTQWSDSLYSELQDQAKISVDSLKASAIKNASLNASGR